MVAIVSQNNRGVRGLSINTTHVILGGLLSDLTLKLSMMESGDKQGEAHPCYCSSWNRAGVFYSCFVCPCLEWS